jgi:trehalose-phosphatase
MPPLLAKYWHAEQEYLALMLDYDGTLTPIVEDPAQAFIHQEHLDVLKRLSTHPKVHLAIVSGRSVEQLKHFLKPLFNTCDTTLLVCGLHGGEVYSPSLSRFLVSLQQDTLKARLDSFYRTFKAALARENLITSGLLLEHKQYTLAMHYRMANESVQQRAMQLLKETFQQAPDFPSTFRLQPGKDVLEIVPRTFDKGSCVKFLMQHWQQDVPLKALKPCYVGDDMTDEAAFAVVNQLQGISLCIGKSGNATCAQYSLPTVDALYQEFACLL